MARQSELAVTRPPAIALAADDVDDDAHDVDESPLRDGRNENSLAYLCQRFCEMYRNHSDPINIDLAAKELGIQRRRMYEILNIIQSVGLVSRLRASFYRWEGQDKMTAALERLKEEGLAHLASTRSAANGSKSAAGCMSPEGQRRKAVATALGERFVQIFLCNEVPQPIILEDIMGLFTSCVGSSAAGGSPAASLTNQTSCARRLYDIANVFCSIGLVRKSCSAATDNRRKKRLYVWIGPVPPATTTPLRPQRASVVAPSASPGAGSSKRLKREPTDTPPPSSARKKSRLASGGLNLEASIIKAERDAETNTSGPSTAIHKVLQHPVVAALRGSSLSTPLIGSLSSANASSASSSLTAGSKRALLIARALEPPAPMSPSSLFNPPNAKDSPPPRSIESSRGSKRPLKFSSMSSSSASPPQLRTASCSTTSKPTATAPPTATTATSSSSSSSSCTSTCSCSSSSSSTDDMSPALLRAQIEQLRKELADAKTREQELLKRIEMQDSQINKLIDAKVLSSSGRPTPSSSSSTNATNSPISSLVFSPFHNAFSSLTASPSPFSSNNFFATGLTGSAHRSGRPPFLRKARIGPHLVDPADTDDALLLSPATTSIASTLLMSPIVDTASGPSSTSSSTAADKEKENAHHLALLDSPVRTNESSSYVAPSTPPCNLIATVASSLLSLTPSQSIGLTMASDDRGDTTEDDDEAEAARANASSPEPRAVRTPATIGAPSSPSPSAKGAKALARVHRTSSALDVLSPLKAAKPRITDCLS